MANQTSTVYQTNTTQLPEWYTQYMSGLAARGNAALGTDQPTPKLNADGTPVLDADGNPVMNPARPVRWGFDADGNPRNMDEQVAGPSDQELQAWQAIQSGQGGYNPYLNQATRMTEAGAQQDIYGALQPFAEGANQMSYAGATYDTQSPAQKYFNIGNNLDFQGASNRGYDAGDRDTASTFDPYSGEALGYTRGGANMNGLAVASPYLNAASGSFPQSADAYMNPYNRNVTDRIAELGARNLGENLLPQVSDDFIKAGQYGSTRQRDFVGRAVRDTQDSILGKQADVLQQGYGQAAQTYQADAARQAGLAGTAGNLGLGQGSLQLQAGQQVGNLGQAALGAQQTDAARQLQAAQLGLSAAQAQASNNQAMLAAQNALSESAAQRKLQGGMNALSIGNSLSGAKQAQANNFYQGGNQFASLGNQQQTQYLRDAAAQEAAGSARRGITQAGLNAGTANAREQEAYPWLNLNRAAGLVSGAQLPSVGSTRGQSTTPGGSTAGQIAGGITAAAGLYNMFGKAKGGAVKKKPNSRVNYGGSPRRGLSMFAKAS